MPKVYDQEIKMRAMKLWVEGVSGPKIVDKINSLNILIIYNF